MGLLFTVFWWLTAFSATLAAAFVAVGDRLVTLLVRAVGKDYVGANFAISWSLSGGWIELHGISLGRAILAIVEPSLGVPMDLEFLRLAHFKFAFPWALLLGKTADKPLQTRVEVGGFELGLSVNAPEKWLAMREENLARFQQAVKDAAVARLARANAWTAATIQKLKELATANATVADNKKRQQKTPPTPTQTAAPAWQKKIDTIVDSLAIVVTSVAITIRDDHAASGVGITMERFELGAAKAPTPDAEHRRQRELVVADFSLFVNPHPSMDKACDVLAPLNMTIRITTPYVIQSLLFGATPTERRQIDVELAFPTDVVLQLRPAQLTKLLQLMRPLAFHGDWFQRALALDEANCVELVGVQRDEYLTLYKEQYTFQNETGFISRTIAGFRQKEQIQKRLERIQELEANLLASRLLYLRSVALDWAIPSGGAALPHVSGSAKRRKDLRTFLATPITTYVPELPVRPMFHKLTLALDLQGVQVQLLDDAEHKVLSIYARGMNLGVNMAMIKVGLDEMAMEVDLKIQRFGINDERNAPSNVFRRLLDQNPGATHLLALRLTQNGAGHLSLDFALEDFTLLVVFDPLMYTAKLFVPALTEDEETELKYLAYAGLQAPPSQERLEEVSPVYKSDVPHEYSPLMLGGMSLKGQIAMYRCEICLLGDSSSLKSHVLALTADTTVKIVSSPRHEAMEIELVDVALQPCTIVILEDAIDLEISGLRTILELEGEGVDLLLGYRLVVGDAKPPLSAASSSDSGLLDSDRKQSGAKLWSRARSAMLKSQITEVEQSRSSENSFAGGEGRTKAGARRKLVLRMSDFALNMSANDLGVLLSIVNALVEAGKEDERVLADRQDRANRLEEAKRKLAEERMLQRLKTEFQLRDTDSGGTLDSTEISGLIANLVNCQLLTKDEFDATVEEFRTLVDRDGSGDVSLEEFESVLGGQKIPYQRLHNGVVALTGQEYVDAARPRSSVPHLKDDGGKMANTAALLHFWERYEQQIGASRTTLNGMSPMLVQQKMVRAFKNYEYAQEAWNRLVNPSLVKPVERSPWVLTKEMNMGSRGSILEQLLTSFDTDAAKQVPALPAHSDREALRMFVHTIVSTSFGGFYIRLIDETVANRVPSIEFSFEELAVYANFAVWESELPTSEADLQVRQRARRNDYGVAKVSFAMYGKYYNPSARQVEPFLEYFPGTLDVRKDPDAPLQILFASDRYFQLNVTFAFMEVVKTNLSTFSKVEAIASRDRPHIKEEGGLFWMVNDTGVNVKYYVVAKKQTKDHVRVETVSAVASVPPSESHPCVLLNLDEDLRENEQQHMKEKQLRQAFRNADSDNSGELDTSEVRAVLVEVYEEEYRNRKRDTRGSMSRQSSGSATASMYTRESAFSSDSELDKLVDDFIAIADTDGSGQVSWDEFKIAIAKTREVVDRFISIEVEGYETLHNVPVSSIGYTQVYELTPYFEDVESEKSVAFLYQQGVMLLNGSDKPTRAELQKAYACFCRVRELDPHYEWIDSYYNECVRKYLPVLIAVNVSIDGVTGLQVKVAGAEYIRNDTDKPTECLLVDDKRQVSRHNPIQFVEGGGKERFFVVPPSGEISIPLDLVDVGAFAIRQKGETEWSNYLPLSVREQRVFKNLTRFEQREAKRGLRDDLSRSSSSLSATRMVSEKMGTDVALPNPNEYVPPGKEVVYPSTNVIDNQPTLVIEKISVNDHQLGTWSIVIQPQLLLHNVLPCGVEYAIVQASDCPADVLDSKGDFRLVSAESQKAVKVLGKIDYFQFVSQVNCRRMFIESGKSLQVFGLDLEKPALMKMRLCASENNRGGTWSAPFFVKLNADREAFRADMFELRFGDQPAQEGPAVVCQQQWSANSERSLTLYAPYWIQNRTGLDFRFRLPKGGAVCTVEAHRAYFNGDKTVPLLASAPATKAMLSIRPYQETAHAYEGDFLVSPRSKKYSPNFDRVEWSEPLDMSSVGTKGEIGANDYSFVVAFEVLAAPSQFFRSRIVRLTPRVIIVNHVPRPLQVTPVTLDKKLRPANLLRGDVVNSTLKQGEALVVYRFAGNEKHHTGLRLRDVFRDEGLKDVGDWSPCIPFKPGDDFNLWTRGPQGDGPAVNVGFSNVEETIIASIEDVSSTPRYRIENRSTRFAFRYVQNNVKGAEEITIHPLQSHSFVWDDPLADDRKLKVSPQGWKIPTLIDLRHIGPRTMLTSNGMYCEVYIDGATRVLAVGDTPTYAADRQRAALKDWLSNTLIDVSVHGFGLTIVDGYPQELLNLTMEKIRLASSVGSRRVVFSLHHMQIDDMTAHSLYPVIFAPIDSGFNSDKQEGWLPQDGDRPFFSLAIDTTPQASGITIVNEFELDMHSIAVKLNLEYLLGLVNVLLEFIPSSEAAALIQQGVDYKDQLLTLELNVPEHAGRGGMLMYFKKWRMAPFDFELVFDSSAEDKGEGISSLLGSTVGSIVGGIAHVTPEFNFTEILYENRFFYEYDLVYSVIVEIVYKVLRQWYKIVGSVELLGDPVGLASDIVDGFALAARQLKRDVKGKSLRKGQSAMTIVQTMIGAPMKSLGKVSNGLGDVVKKVTRFESQEEEDQPRHVPEGIVQSGVVFTKSLAYGVKGFVKEPVQGAKRGGFKGFAKGVGRGTLQLMASPVVGTLGVVEKLTTSVNNTTHLMDEKQFEGTRRPARDLGASALKPLSDSNVITEVEFHVLHVEGLPEKANPQILVRVFKQENGGPAHDVTKYKSSTLHHTGTPNFNQSWLLPVTSPDTFIEVQVLHKRKPLPKKPLGYLRFSMEDIYREFEGVPANVLWDPKVKLRLRRRKRVRGSILNELALTSSQMLEKRDDSWRQKINRPSMATFMDEYDQDNDEDGDYEQDMELLSQRSIVVDQPLEVKPVAFPLLEAENPNAKVFLSVRYVNDMRR